MSLIKRQLREDQTRGYLESRDAARALLATAKEAPDYREGVVSFLERRPPRFDGLSSPGLAG
jgi:enoyl-CoA hydratase/carnithine racemase